MTGIEIKILSYIGVGLAFVFAVLGIYKKGKSVGEKKVINEIHESTLSQVIKEREKQNEVREKNKSLLDYAAELDRDHGLPSEESYRDEAKRKRKTIVQSTRRKSNKNLQRKKGR